MAEHNKLGIRGENIAAEYLLAESYTILEKNWRLGRLEIDIIASKGDRLVVVEVKTRTGVFVENLDEAVDRRKQELLVRAANAYVAGTGLDADVRFDIVTVIVGGTGKAAVNHIENAFYPQLKK